MGLIGLLYRNYFSISRLTRSFHAMSCGQESQPQEKRFGSLVLKGLGLTLSPTLIHLESDFFG